MPKSCGVRCAVPNNTLCQKRKYNITIFGRYFMQYTYKTIHPTNYIFHKMDRVNLLSVGELQRFPARICLRPFLQSVYIFFSSLSNPAQVGSDRDNLFYFYARYGCLHFFDIHPVTVVLSM